MFFAHNAGVRKPDPRFDLELARFVGVAPRHIWHTGDSLEEDYHAATAGLTAFLLTRHPAGAPASPETHAIASLLEICDLLDSTVFAL